MTEALNSRFELNHVGVTKRFRFYLIDPEGKIILTSQLRELKPMCTDEMKWIRKIAAKDSSYDRVNSEKGYVYMIRAADGHELGRGNYHETAQAREDEIALVKQYAQDADYIDKTPEEGRLRTRDFLEEKSIEVLSEQGLSYG